MASSPLPAPALTTGMGQTVDAGAIREASIWYARLASGTASEQDQQQWAGWHAASPANQQAWQTVEAVRHQLGRVPGNIAAPALSAAASRRQVLRSVLALVSTGSAAWVSYRALPWQDWTADYRTATGERRDIRLADGSQLSINTRSAVDIVFDGQRRLIRLHAGEIFIRTAADAPTAAGMARPFTVETPHGEVLALGTVFSVRTDGESSLASVLEKAVRVQPVSATQSMVLQAGQQLRFSAQTLGQVSRYNPLASSWTNGSLTVIDTPLAQVVDELARYRPGLLRCDPAIATLKISGTFPLDDTDRALAALTHGFPLRVMRHTRYWVTLLPAA